MLPISLKILLLTHLEKHWNLFSLARSILFAKRRKRQITRSDLSFFISQHSIFIKLFLQFLID